jgi:hypothetical protein
MAVQYLGFIWVHPAFISFRRGKLWPAAIRSHGPGIGSRKRVFWADETRISRRVSRMSRRLQRNT